MTNLEKYLVNDGIINLSEDVLKEIGFKEARNIKEIIQFLLSEAEEKYEPTVEELHQVIADYKICNSDGHYCSDCSHYGCGTYMICDGTLDKEVVKILEWALEQVELKNDCRD